MKSYHQRWISLFDDSEEIIKNTYSFLIDKYSEQNRRYHTLRHVMDCLDLFDSVKEMIDDPWEFEIALWFHDVFYNVFSTRNEIRSAKAAVKFLQSLGAEKYQTEKVYSLILVTGHENIPLKNDEKYLSDIDLSILGSSRERFLDYERSVRLEYGLIPKPVYKKQREKLLRGFLEKDRIYYTDYFHERFNESARDNIFFALNEML